jgi:hypothetical protein
MITHSIIHGLIIALAALYTEGYHVSEHYNVCIDPAFSDHERALIVEGMSIWNTNKIRFVEAEPCTTSILKATAWDERWTEEDHVGFTDFYSNQSVLFTNRCNSDGMFRWIAAHEAGHIVGLLHIDPMQFPAIMDSVVREDAMNDLKLYPKDLEQLCEVWKECK